MSESKPSHRERLIDGMIAAAARHGYRNASVARAVAQAGVSRATFYSHFDDRDDCFRAACREVAGRLDRGLRRIDVEGGSAAGGPREALAELLAAADRDPAAARLVLIEALAGDPVVRAEHEQLLDRAEDRVERYLDGPAGESRFDIPARALIGGVGSAIAIRSFRGEAGVLPGLCDDLVAWLESYAVPGDRSRHSSAAWAKLGEGMAPPLQVPAETGPRPLPRGRSALPPGAVAREHRDRILAAVARLAREKGYLEMTVADIAAAAAVTRETFYELFRGKEDAFLAVQTTGLQESVSSAAGEFFGASTWPDRVWNAAVAMIGYVASHPDHAHVELVESFAAGAGAIRQSSDNRMAYTLFLEDGYRQRPQAERLPRLCSEAIGGALNELMRRHVVAGRTAQLPELIPEGVYLAIAPFVGATEAIDFVEAKVAAEGASRGARGGGAPRRRPSTPTFRTPSERSSAHRVEG